MKSLFYTIFILGVNYNVPKAPIFEFSQIFEDALNYKAQNPKKKT